MKTKGKKTNKKKKQKTIRVWGSETFVNLDIYKQINPDILVKIDGISWIYDKRSRKKDEREIKEEMEKCKGKGLVPILKKETMRYRYTIQR